MMHVKCRSSFYPFSKVARFPVAENQVPWNIIWNDYNPPTYNSDSLLHKPYADPDINDPEFKPKWNALDGKINRKSHVSEYSIVNSHPLNPEGRTGLRGRGVLGRWGPNHAADPIVSRWKRLNGEKCLHFESKLPLLQICVIQRRDCNEWALPGGMVDPGEHVSVTLRREFMEEAMNSMERNSKLVMEDKDMVEKFFSQGQHIFKGYVDDQRNTDNAWIETVAVNFHDDTGTAVGKFSLQAGDDAKNVKWLDISKKVMLYASHSKLVEEVVKLHQAHW